MKNNQVFNSSQLDRILMENRATPLGEPKGGFYRIRHQEVQFPDGTTQTREYIEKRRASVVVPLTEEGNLVFVIQPVALAEEGALIEFPAGYWELREDGKSAGLRELQEETGYAPKGIIYVGSHYQDPGSIRQKVDVYLAEDCEKITDQCLDRGEYVQVVEVSPTLALAWADKGYFSDANTYIALMKVARIMNWN